ncbi:nitroreductase family protein [Desulfosporosinus sp. Sb-LF]|uniref:nitroreductase family protein n=1 Tax=Desulfosporosinus sp. Sb-LF TaxID=2560027 RepID=UPI00107FB7F3|nr:nitroreductase family protein [Desulfosporosinus sp. Sb-LF]TGE31610.1 nitroreductase family protein [Desulfosporosinus sp. Sb-LF]
MEAILSRRSIRKYTNQTVSKEIVHELLEAGMCAPSAGNERPWHFIVIEERPLLEEIMKVHQFSKMLNEAPLAILVCADVTCDKYPGTNYWIQDCAAATENILIAAKEKDLGTCWLGVYPKPERVEGIRNIFALPAHVFPFCVIALGHPAEIKAPIVRYDETRVHHNCW